MDTPLFEHYSITGKIPDNTIELLKYYQEKSGQEIVFLSITSGWCPDCIKGTPRVKPALISRATSTCKRVMLVTVDVGTREEWRDPNGYLRIDPVLQVTNIPTLFYFDESLNVVGKLVECDLYDPPETLNTFLDEIFSLHPRD